MAESPHTLQRAILSPKLTLLMGDPDTHLIHNNPLRESKPIIRTASRLVQPFSHRWLQSVPILYNGQTLPPSKLPLLTGDLDPNLIHGFLGPPVLNPNCISIGAAVFVGLTSVTGRQTDRQTMLLGR